MIFIILSVNVIETFSVRMI